MTKAQRGAVCRYLARFAELDDAKIFYAYGHADELAAKGSSPSGSFAYGPRISAPGVMR